MDEMNPLENRLQSWTPRRPSPEIARRLFGPAQKPSLHPARRAGAWNWLCHGPGRRSSDAAFFATLMLDAAATSNIAAVSLSDVGGNLEYNIWPHPQHLATAIVAAETPLRRRDIWNLIPTNY
jgi:hypothetical protein